MARFSFVVTAIVHINHINPVRCCLLGSVLDHIIFFAATINKFKSARLLSDVASLIGLWGGEFVVARIMASIAVFVVEHRPMWHKSGIFTFLCLLRFGAVVIMAIGKQGTGLSQVDPLSLPRTKQVHHGHRRIFAPNIRCTGTTKKWMRRDD
jgi:hypothetical protein